MPEVSFVLPALNEGRGVGSVIDRIPVNDLVQKGYDVNVWLVDGHSTDQTVAVARDRGARVIMQDGRGKGRGMSQAFGQIKSDYVIMLDADNTYDPRDSLAMMPLLEDGHDVVMGSRMLGDPCDEAMSFRHMLGNKLLSGFASALYGKHTSDLCTGFWGFKGRVLRNLPIDAKGFELEAQLFSRCARYGLVIGEVPISYGCRSGDVTKLRSLSSGANILFALFRERFKSKRRIEAGTSTPAGLRTSAFRAGLHTIDGKVDTDH